MTLKMSISEAGLALIKEYEGCKLEAYLCPAGIWTVGVGHTGPDVFRGRKITDAEADALLRKDVAHAERCVNMSVNVALLQHEFDALVSLVFNIGCAAFRGSTLLRKLNDGDDAAPEEFRRWNKAGGKELAGLTRRRQAEYELFESVA